MLRRGGSGWPLCTILMCHTNQRRATAEPSGARWIRRSRGGVKVREQALNRL